MTRREVLNLLDDQRTPARIRRCSGGICSGLVALLDEQSQDGAVLPDVSELTAELNDRLGTS